MFIICINYYKIINNKYPILIDFPNNLVKKDQNWLIKIKIISRKNAIFLHKFNTFLHVFMIFKQKLSIFVQNIVYFCKKSFFITYIQLVHRKTFYNKHYMLVGRGKDGLFLYGNTLTTNPSKDDVCVKIADENIHGLKFPQYLKINQIYKIPIQHYYDGVLRRTQQGDAFYDKYQQQLNTETTIQEHIETDVLNTSTEIVEVDDNNV